MKNVVARDVQAVADYLRLCIQAERRTLKSIETELGLGEGYLGQLLRGAVDLKLKHVLGVLAVLRIDPLEFFSAVYGRSGGVVPHRPMTLTVEPEWERPPRRRPLASDEVVPGVTEERLFSAIENTLRRLGYPPAEEELEEAPPGRGRARKKAG